MSEILIAVHEDFEAALRRFNKKVMFDGVLSETKRRTFYEKPSDRKRKEIARSERRLVKKKLRSGAKTRAGR